jgi:hypothetical protein
LLLLLLLLLLLFYTSVAISAQSIGALAEGNIYGTASTKDVCCSIGGGKESENRWRRRG